MAHNDFEAKTADEILASIHHRGSTRLVWECVDPAALYPHPRFRAYSPCGTIEFRIMAYMTGHRCDWHLMWMDVDGPRRFARGLSAWFPTVEAAQNAAANWLHDAMAG
jgi:hypothetical protein